jgi:Tfp pilus assembly protein PilN
MIQFNLLPEVKLEYIKTQRLKRMVIGISLIASAAALVVFIFLLLTVDVFQKKNINDLSKDIVSSSKELKQKPNLSKMLTVQSQLRSLTALHDQKPSTSRLFGFISQLTPTKASISQLKLDMDAGTMSITGNATTLDVVNEFADSLKYTTYKTSQQSDAAQNAFSDVVLTSFDRNDKNASYIIDMTFDPNIFSNADNVELTINKTAAEQAASVILKGEEQ